MSSKWMRMSIWTDICALLFPRLCVVCGKILTPSEEGVCVSCLSKLPYTRLLNTPGNEMEKCFWGRLPVERASSLFFYSKGGMVSDILYSMKYHGRKRLCCTMGRLLAGELESSGFFDGVDVLVPLPLSDKRLRQRGYNQSEWLAEGIRQLTGIPLCTDVVARSRNNVTQTHKSRYERWQNVENLFCLTGKPHLLEGRHVLLVDDVLTTGATLVACADALSGIKGIRISIVTLAWTK